MELIKSQRVRCNFTFIHNSNAYISSFVKKYTGQHDPIEMRRSILSLVSKSYFYSHPPRFVNRMMKERQYFPLIPEYRVCVDEINIISLLMDPDDMMDCIEACTKLINEIAGTFLESRTVSADDFLPIMETVLM